MQVEVIFFWKNLERIKNVLTKSDREFAKFLEISYGQYLKCKKNQVFLPLGCIYQCAEKLNFYYTDLLYDNFSLQSVVNTINNGQNLDEKYSHATYSTLRPFKNVLTYLEKEKGEQAKINLLRKFQISDKILNQPDQKTNIHLLTDAVRYLRATYQLSELDLISIGRMTPNANKDFEIGLSTKKNAPEVVEFFLDEYAHLFDKNYTYSIEQLSNNQSIIQALPNKNVVEELGLKFSEFGSEDVCLTRMGVLSSIMWPKFKKYADVQKISSIYSGDKSHRYIIDLSPFKKLSSFADISMETGRFYH